MQTTLLLVYVCDNTTLPIIQSPHALPPMNNTTLPQSKWDQVHWSQVFGTLRYLNQNEQHYTTLPIKSNASCDQLREVNRMARTTKTYLVIAST